MNKNLLKFLVSLIILLGLGLYFLLEKGDKLSDKDWRNFALSEAKDIDKIILSGGGKDTLILNKADSVWQLNKNGIADVNKVNELLRIAKVLQPKFKIQQAKTPLVFVQFLSGEKVVKSYYLGGNANDSIGFYGSLEKDSPKFVLHIPGEAINLSAVFSPKVESWKSLVLVQNASIYDTKIELQYSSQKENSFSIEMKNQVPVLKNFQGQKMDKIVLDKGADYLRQFKKISAKAFLKQPLDDKQASFFELKVNQNFVLKGYRKRAEKNQKDFSGKPLLWDNEFFYGLVGTNWYLLDYFTFDGILKTPADFSADVNP